MAKRTSTRKKSKTTKKEKERKPVLKASRKVLLKTIPPPVVEQSEEKKTSMNSHCHCERRAIVRTSWTNNNTGRRFFTCERKLVMTCLLYS